MEFAIEEFMSQLRRNLGIFVLQFLDEAIHLHLGEEVNDFLPVFLAEGRECLWRRTLYGENNLVNRILVACELHRGLGIDLTIDIHEDDIAKDIENAIKALGVHLRNMERALGLGQTRYIGIQHSEEGTAMGRLPIPVTHDDHDLIGASAGAR